MFKNLWYKLFGHPTVDAALADFHKFTAKLQAVADVHSGIAAEKAKIVAEASALRDTASLEVDKAKAQIAKFEAWLS